MKLYSKKTNFATSNAEKSTSVWLYFYVVGQQEWLNCGLPTPTLLIPLQHSYYIGYKIEGYFATHKNKKFLQDIIARIIITLAHEGAQKVEYLHYKPYLGNKDIIHYNKDYVYNLRDDIAPNLLSLQEPRKITDRDKALKYISYYNKNTEDELFDAIRYTVYEFVRMNGKDALTYEYVETIAKVKFELIGSKKGWSTAKAKAKSIYKWVKEHYKVGTDKSKKTNRTLKEYLEETMATRVEHMKKLGEQREEQNKQKVLNFIKGLTPEDKKYYTKKSSGAWHYNKIADAIGLSNKTVAKHIKELKEEGFIP